MLKTLYEIMAEERLVSYEENNTSSVEEKIMTPKDTVSQLVHEATQLRNQAKQALLTGIHADEAPIVGDWLVKAFVPYGAKGLARGVGRTIRKSSKSNVSVQWRQKGELFLPRCESVVKNTIASR